MFRSDGKPLLKIIWTQRAKKFKEKYIGPKLKSLFKIFVLRTRASLIFPESLWTSLLRRERVTEENGEKGGRPRLNCFLVISLIISIF